MGQRVIGFTDNNEIRNNKHGSALAEELISFASTEWIPILFIHRENAWFVANTTCFKELIPFLTVGASFVVLELIQIDCFDIYDCVFSKHNNVDMCKG